MKMEKDVSQWKTMTTVNAWLTGEDAGIFPMIVDIGASDGKLNSNSYNLVVDSGWKAILVEPNPAASEKAQLLYKDTSRVTVVNCAVSDQEGEMTLSMPSNPDDDQLASLVRTFEKNIKVQVISPKTLVEKYDINRVGILSVDTEGHDLPILESWMAETSVRPEVVITESWPHLGYQNLYKAGVMAKEGYIKVMTCGENEIYYRAKT